MARFSALSTVLASLAAGAQVEAGVSARGSIELSERLDDAGSTTSFADHQHVTLGPNPGATTTLVTDKDGGLIIRLPPEKSHGSGGHKPKRDPCTSVGVPFLVLGPLKSSEGLFVIKNKNKFTETLIHSGDQIIGIETHESSVSEWGTGFKLQC